MNNYKIILNNGAEVEASEYQCNIFDNIEHGVGNMVINAAAGSAKTTTIINALRFIPDNKKTLFIAFNTDIVATIKGIVDRKNTRISTFHSLGRSILKENGILPDNAEPFEFKYINYIKNNIINITEFQEVRSLGAKYSVYINNLCLLSEYCRYYLAFTTKEIERIANIYGIIPVRDEFSVCREVLKWGKSNLDVIDYTDMIWLPNVLNLQTKMFQYDWIFIDEAQDTTIAEQKMIEKCFKRGARFVAVGDESQQINTWCGSTEEAINLLRAKPNTKDYPLTVSYRCPKSVIRLAQNYGRIEEAPNAIEGEVNYDTSITDAKAGDMILCRTTAPIISEYLKMLSYGKKVYIRGCENIKKSYLDLVKGTKSRLIDRNSITTDGMFPMLYKGLLNEIERVKSYYSIDNSDALTFPTVIEMYDNIEGLKALSEGITETSTLIDKISMIFEGDDSDAIIFSTVHKAKGGEANNVFILRPSLMPSKLAHKEWEIKAENNLIYVAYTRAKKSLNFIKEDVSQLRSNGYFNLAKMRDEIDNIAARLEYNKAYGTGEDEMPSLSVTAHTLGVVSLPTPASKQKKVKGGLKFRNLM